MLVIFRVTDGVSDRQISLLRGKSSLTANGRAQTPYSQLNGRSALSYTIIIQILLCFPGGILQKNKNKLQHVAEIAIFWAANVLESCGGSSRTTITNSDTGPPTLTPFAGIRGE